MDDYADFELLIARVRKKYLARVLRSPSGAGEGVPFALPSMVKNLRGLPERRSGRHLEIRQPDDELAEDFGERLFQAVFAGRVLELWRESVGRAGRKLCLRLRLGEDPHLLDIPWERLVDPALGPLAVAIPLLRVLDAPVAPRPLSVPSPLRVLCILSSPPDIPPLDVEREWAALDQALGEEVKLEPVPPALFQIGERLQKAEWHVLHFVGHGEVDEKGGVLYLENPSGIAQPVDHLQLGVFLAHESLRLIVLNSCEGARTGRSNAFSGVAQALVKRGIPAVVAMQQPISDAAAIVFAKHLYGALARGSFLGSALVEARKALLGEHKAEWAIPVLYLNGPDGYIVTLRPAISPPNLWWIISSIAAGVVLLSLVIWLLARGPAPAPKPPLPKPRRTSAENPKTCLSPKEMDIAFVEIPGGVFEMGDKMHRDGRPVHQVSITQPFCLSVYEVTRELWSRVLKTPPPPDDQLSVPVQGITLEEARHFMDLLNELDPSGHHRLATEAEWELAARAGTQTVYSFGSDEEALPLHGNCRGGEDGFAGLAPVGQLRANGLGLHDMYGNVYEWVSDWYGPYSGKREVNPRGRPVQGERGIRRGGSWESGAHVCSSGHRSIVQPNRSNEETGFRIVREIR